MHIFLRFIISYPLVKYFFEVGNVNVTLACTVVVEFFNGDFKPVIVSWCFTFILYMLPMTTVSTILPDVLIKNFLYCHHDLTVKRLKY